MPRSYRSDQQGMSRMDMVVALIPVVVLAFIVYGIFKDRMPEAAWYMLILYTAGSILAAWMLIVLLFGALLVWLNWRDKGNKSEKQNESEPRQPQATVDQQDGASFDEALCAATDRQLQLLIRDTAPALLSLALHGASDTAVQRIVSQMGSRGGAMLSEDIAQEPDGSEAVVEARKQVLAALANAVADA